jgi:hypothetical protein
MGSKDNRVVVRTGSTLRTEVMANGYTLLADEPIGVTLGKPELSHP